MQLSDGELKALLSQMNIKTPEYAPAFSEDEQVQPASIDLRVDRVVWRSQRLRTPIDLTSKLSTRTFATRQSYKSDLGPRGKFRLKPGDIVMTRTLEEFSIPDGFAAEIFTRSSFGRLGLSITCAGVINPGYRGHMPLQIKNLGTEIISFPPLISICQLVLQKLSSIPKRPYGAANLRSKYLNDDGGPSRWWMDSIIKKNQESVGATNMPTSEQDKLLPIILSRDLSTQLRFETFLKAAKTLDLETADSALDAFAKTERRAMTKERLLTGAAAIILLLVSVSFGAIFSTPFNEQKYGAAHITLWVVTIIAVTFYMPVVFRKLRAREADFLLPEDLINMRSRQSGSG